MQKNTPAPAAPVGKNRPQAVDYWCEDLRFTVESEKACDPLQGVKETLDLLDDRGHCDMVRSVLAFMASGTSCDTGSTPVLSILLPTVTDELLVDFRAVAATRGAATR